MNIALFTAGAVMIAAAIIHGVVGDGVLRKIGLEQLPLNPFGGGPKDTKALMRTTWHFGTVAFAVVGAWLLMAATRPQADFTVGASYVCGTLLSCFALTGMSVAVYRRGLSGFYTPPGPLLLATAAVLVWMGAITLQ